MHGLTNEQAAGQRIMAGFDGTGLNADLKYLIDTIGVGGIILFSRNLTDPEQIRDLCFSASEYAAACGQPPLFVAIDQEGGQVARLREPFTVFPGNPSMRGEADAIGFAERTASELAGVGINMNMAPVLDVAIGENSVMAGRAFGSDPERVAMLGVKVIEHLQSNGVMATAKHFPGIGRTILDSHIEMPDLDTDTDDLEADLAPFKAAIACGVSAIMLSHIRYTKIDPEWPAGLSSRIVKDLLRDRMGYDGVAITDDLDMGAIGKNFRNTDVIGRIMESEVDIALICHKGPFIRQAFDAILKSAGESERLKQKNNESVERIMALKKRFLSANFCHG